MERLEYDLFVSEILLVAPSVNTNENELKVEEITLNKNEFKHQSLLRFVFFPLMIHFSIILEEIIKRGKVLKILQYYLLVSYILRVTQTINMSSSLLKVADTTLKKVKTKPV